MPLFVSRATRDEFDREVLREMAYLRDLYGADAQAKAVERAARPLLRGRRRRIIEEAAKRLAAEKRAAPPPAG